ncbi:MAG TPA: menaquinone biosynthesis protein [Tepidisphaeraceae bacterium]|jgi:chorismate dehydratase|nr:menaquinone biosynthesis protein [Tepidisphaeraceae bacterium]
MINDKPSSRVLRIGSVSYLNAKPLIHGLENDRDVELELAVPAKLLEGLQSRRFDVALLPVIDYQRLSDARIVPSGGIGCDGPTLTVRIFSRTPIEQIATLACDVESHSSVALARILLAERYGITPRLVDLPAEGSDAPAMLLIGDKVVSQEPVGMEYQLDLGAAWKELTQMPFVFAVWVTRAGTDLADLPDRLRRARDRGLADLPNIVARHAVSRGWPADLAMQYLSVYLKYEIGPAQLDAIRHFHELAAKYAMIGTPRPLRLY